MNRFTPEKLGICLFAALTLVSCATAPNEEPLPVESASTLFEPKPLAISPPYPQVDYPAAAKKARRTGRVSMAYSVGADGRARKIALIESAGLRVLDDAAVAELTSLRFQVPSAWVETGGPSKRFQFNMIFQIVGEPQLPPFENKQNTLTITAREVRTRLHTIEQK